MVAKLRSLSREHSEAKKVCSLVPDLPLTYCHGGEQVSISGCMLAHLTLLEAPNGDSKLDKMEEGVGFLRRIYFRLLAHVVTAAIVLPIVDSISRYQSIARFQRPSPK